jgi:hypothetical protein
MSIGGNGAFSLLEVLIAACLLACVTTAATSLTLVSGREVAAVARASAARGIAAATLERLRSLPFVRPPSTGTAPVPPSVVGELFPHAVTALNRVDAFVSGPVNGGGATFTTHSQAGDVAITNEAMFVRSTAGGWRPVPWSAVEGFVADQAAVLPGDALRVKVTVRWPAGALMRTYALDAVLAGDQQTGHGDASLPAGD